MRYKIEYLNQAKRDLKNWRKSGNKAVVRKIYKLIEELSMHPYSGTGKPEPLKHVKFVVS